MKNEQNLNLVLAVKIEEKKKEKIIKQNLKN